MLGSPDPELRDDIAYATFAAWIYQKRLIEPPLLRVLIAQWIRNLEQDIGAEKTDAIFRRSFSALALSVVAARDNEAPFLQPNEFRQVLTAALTYLQAEQDLRGYDPASGWMHSAAHTADLLKFLGRSRFLEPKDQHAVLDAIASKLAAANVVFTHGEDERFARAVLSVVNRPDFDSAFFRTWLTRVRPAPFTTPRPTLEQLRGSQNVKNMFAKLEVILSIDPRPSDTVQATLDNVRGALKNLF